MNIGWAIETMKSGARVRRSTWRIRDMWIGITKQPIRISRIRTDLVMSDPFIVVRTTGTTFVPWCALQSDLLADDWVAFTPVDLSKAKRLTKAKTK